MDSIQSFLHPVVAGLLRPVPLSAEKVQCAWTMAVGSALSRVSKVWLGSAGQLVVVLDDARWKDEIWRSRALILERLQRVLGDDAVVGIDIRAPQSDRPRRGRRQGRPVSSD